MANLLLLLASEDTLPLLVVVIALALIVGLVTRQKALRLIGGAIAVVLSIPFISQLIDLVPTWVLLVSLPVFALMLFQVMVGALFGKAAASEAVGSLIAHATLGLFRLLLLPLKVLAAAIGLLFARRGF